VIFSGAFVTIDKSRLSILVTQSGHSHQQAGFGCQLAAALSGMEIHVSVQDEPPGRKIAIVCRRCFALADVLESGVRVKLETTGRLGGQPGISDLGIIETVPACRNGS